MDSRREVWYRLSGAGNLLEEGLYRKYLEKKVEQVDSCKDEEQIDRDVERIREETLDWAFEGRSAALQDPGKTEILEATKRVLKAFVKRNGKTIGYVQGQQNMCLMVLSEYIVLEQDQVNVKLREREEERAFWVFCALCEIVLGENFFSLSPKLEGFKKAVAIVNSCVDREKFEPAGSAIDQAGVIELLCLKWFLQLWSDEELLHEVTLAKRIWDCMFFTSAGLSTQVTPEDAMKSTFCANWKPKKSDFHIRLSISMIRDMPILATYQSEDEDGANQPLNSATVPREDEDTLLRPRSWTSLGGNASDRGRRSHSPSSPTAQQFSIPPLRRKASLEEMGVHATAHVFDAILHGVRFLKSKKLEELILVSEHCVIAQQKTSQSNSMLMTVDEREESQRRDQESKGMIAYIRKLSESQQSIVLSYAVFKQIAQQACPSWTSRDTMEVFSSLDLARNGQVGSNFLLEQLPGRFPERSLQDLESLASSVYTFSVQEVNEMQDGHEGAGGGTTSASNRIEQKARIYRSAPSRMESVDESCSTSPLQCRIS